MKIQNIKHSFSVLAIALGMVVSSHAVVIDSFDDNQLDLNPASGTVGGYWFSYVDTYGSSVDQNVTTLEDPTTWASGSLTTTMSLVADNAAANEYAYVGVGVSFEDGGLTKVPVDLSGWTSITVNYSTNNPILMQLSTLADETANDGTEWYCELPPTATSKVCLIPTSFTQPSWVTSGRAFDASTAVSLKFTTKTVGTTTLTLNEISMDGGSVVTPSSSSVATSSSTPVSSSVITSSSSSIPASGPVIIDSFDDNQLDLNPASGTVGGYWFSYVDTYGSTVDQNTTTLEDPTTWASGSLTTNMSLVADNPPEYAYVGIGIDFADRGGATMPAVPVDLSSWTSITVSYSTNSDVQLQWVSTDDDPSDGAEHYCVLPASSTSVTCLLQSGVGGFSQPSWVTTQARAFNKSSVIGLKFTTKTVGSTTLTLNEISMDGGTVNTSSSSAIIVSSSSTTPVSSSSIVGILDQSQKISPLSVTVSGNLLNVAFSANTQIQNLAVVNASGSVVRSLQNSKTSPLQLSLKGLDAGIYFLRLESNHEVYSKKIEIR